MTRRIFVTVTRGMTDKTAVCIYPWEKRLLEMIHGGDVQEVTIEEMCSMKGAAKIEKIKIPKRDPDEAEHDKGLSLREQLQAMALVDSEEDPTDDPVTEYGRLVDKYGMDKEIPLPVVTRVYGEFDAGTFEAALKAATKGTRDEPARIEFDKPMEEMTSAELRAQLTLQGIDFDKAASKPELRDLLATVTA